MDDKIISMTLIKSYYSHMCVTKIHVFSWYYHNMSYQVKRFCVWENRTSTSDIPIYQ